MAAVSIKDVARHAGLSVGTVSTAINRPDDVSADALARVTRAIAELDYVPNRAARQLRAGVGSTIGFVVLTGENPFFNAVMRGVEDEAGKSGFAVIYGNTDEDARREAMYLDLFEEQRVRGVLISPYGDITPRLQRLRSQGIAVVLVDRFSGDGRFSSVSVDSVAGGRLAVEHLIASGRRRIGFVGGPFDMRQVRDRLDGARAAAENAETPAEVEVLVTAALTVEEGVRIGQRILERPRRERPDALFAANDLVALGLLQSLMTGGRSTVPDEIALIGFDDIPFAAAAAVPLSSIRQPSRTIGQTALRVLLEETADPGLVPRQTIFPPELVARASTA